MKIIVQIARILTGLLFIFSGAIKLNDPSGFSIKLNEYFDVFAQDVAQHQDSLKISLKEGSQVIGSKSYVLHSSDITRDLVIESESEARKDTAGKVLGFDANIELSMMDETVAESDFGLPDSASTALYTVAAEVAGKPIFSKTYRVSALQPTTETKNLKLQEFVKPEGWLHGFFKGMKDFSLSLSVFICALEVILGFALIVGWKSRLTAWMLLLLIVFFTFLTFYAAYFNKVTDCGCFGDFIKLKPWHSFYKDLILLVLIIIVFIGYKHIKPWFSKKFGWKFMAVISLLSFGFGVFCYRYLPVWDFLPYKKGNDILKLITYLPPGQRATDSTHMYYMMHKGADSVEVPFINSPYKEYMDKKNAGWTPGRRIDKVIVEGYKWPIKDFGLSDPKSGMDMKDSLLQNEGFQLLWVVPFVDKTYMDAIPEIRETWKWAGGKNVQMLAVTATGFESAAEFAKTNKLEFSFLGADEKMLKTMARYNSTLYLMNGPVVVDKWSSRNLPSTSKLDKLIRK